MLHNIVEDWLIMAYYYPYNREESTLDGYMNLFEELGEEPTRFAQNALVNPTKHDFTDSNYDNNKILNTCALRFNLSRKNTKNFQTNPNSYTKIDPWVKLDDGFWITSKTTVQKRELTALLGKPEYFAIKNNQQPEGLNKQIGIVLFEDTDGLVHVDLFADKYTFNNNNAKATKYNNYCRYHCMNGWKAEGVYFWPVTSLGYSDFFASVKNKFNAIKNKILGE